MQTTDCQQGLFCVQQPTGPSMCSTDFATIVSTEEAGADAAGQAMAPAADGAPAGEGAPPTDGGSSPAPDVKTAPPPDTGTPKEAQASEASPPPDVARETSAPRPDASADDAGD